MVLLDVIATEKNGTLITDLHPSDIEVLEDGRPQNVKLFSRASNGSARSGQGPPPHLPPNVYSNRPEYSQPAGPLVLLLLDGINTAGTDQGYARRQLLGYVRTLKADQRVAIFALTTDLLLLQDFTSDPRVLSTALEKYSPNDSFLLTRGTPVQVTAQMATAMPPAALKNLIRFNQDNAVESSDERVRVTLAALQAVARAMIGYPGRKNLIWVSSGFPVSIQLSGSNAALSRNYAADLTATATLLSQAQVSVYPVDARGLIGNLQDTPNANEIVSTVQSSDNGSPGAEELTRIAPLVVDSHFAMEQIAHDTGGRAFYNANDLAGAVATGVTDGNSYYTLGYYPENKNWDGKFRKISIKAERKDIKLRYRPGYYAFDATQLAGASETRRRQDRAQELLRAIKDPLPATGVTFWAHLIRQRMGDSATFLEFVVDANSLSFAEAGAHHDCNVDFAALSVASDGSVSNTVVKTVETSVPASVYATLRKRGLPFRMQITSLPERGTLRLGVRDNRTGLLGTLTIPISPNLVSGGVNR